MINRERLVKLFLDLVVLDSESGHERPVCDFLKTHLKRFTDDVIEDDAGASFGGNAGNLIARLPGNAPGAPRIALNAHQDVIKPGQGVRPMVSGDIITSSGDTVLGSDDKAGLAVILETLHVLEENSLPHGDLLIIMTVSEETHLNGARHLAPELLTADFGFTLDCAAAGDIYTSSPSHKSLNARIIGRAAHAGIEPEKGKNAIWIASRAIARMNLGRIDDETTANVGIIARGDAPNIVPPYVTLQGEARSRNAGKLEVQIRHMTECLEHTAREYEARAEIEIKQEYDCYQLAEDSAVVRHAVAAAQRLGIEPRLRSSGGGSDANIFNALGMPAAPLGCAMTDCHTTQESLKISVLEGVARYVAGIVHAQ